MIDLRSVLSAIKPYVLGWVKSYMDVSARVYNNAAISVANDTIQALTFNSERWDTDGLHSTSVNTGRLTCTQAAKYMIGGHVENNANTTGRRAAMIRLNGSTYIAVQTGNATAAGNMSQSITTEYDLAVGDYLELCVYQNSGGALNINASGNYSPEFWMQRVS